MVKPTGKDKSVRYENAYRYEIGPDGLVFLTDVWAVKVMGGKQVAKRYRVKMRVSSNKSSDSLTHNGPVFPIDYLNAVEDK